MDISKEKMLAYLYEQSTYDRSIRHQNKHGDLPRLIWKNVDGSRGCHYTNGVYFPSPMQDRLFHSWTSWREIDSEDGKKRFVVGIVPLDRFQGTKERFEGADKYAQGETTAISIIEEIAPNVCRWTRIQTVNVNASVPAKVLNFQAQKQIGQANEVLEKHRRNDKVVDKEIRDALIERIREGVEVTEEQEDVFKDLDNLFGKEEGWMDLKSPDISVKMQIKLRQLAKGASITLGRAKGVVDCTPEEACAWYFEYCSEERNSLGFKGADLARLEITKAKRPRNEKAFASVKKFPWPLRPREVRVGAKAGAK